MTSTFLYSPRLLFIAGSPDLLQVELAGSHLVAQVLNVVIPQDWPSDEYDQDAMRFF